MEPLLVCALCLFALLIVHVKRRSRLPLPPGPPGYPIIGNLFDVGSREEWITYKAISDRYRSDIISFNILGTPVIVLNSLEVVQEFLEKRSALYSDRPRFTMLNELCGMDYHFGFMRYDDRWKEHRKLFKKEFQPPATEQYKPCILSATRMLLRKLLDEHKDFDSQLRHMTITIILGIGYGIDVQPKEDPYVGIGEKSLQAMAGSGNSTQFLVDQLPYMKYLPSWFPGCGFQILAKDWRQAVRALPKAPMDYVLKAIANGTGKPCVATNVLSALENIDAKSSDTKMETVLHNMLGSAYAASTDTTVSAIESFILAMVQNPEILKKGQAAVDKAIGGERLPDFMDRGSIPFVEALLKETLRWNPVTPLAVPHRAIKDDEYMGYRIPAGATVVPNAWAILHDESIYGADTHLFNPDRFMNKDGTLKTKMRHPVEAFGVGRRQCPGIDMAESTVWIGIASLLACFDMVKYVDENGVVDEPSGEYTSGMLCYPLPFKCTFRPRNERVKSLIKSEIL